MEDQGKEYATPYTGGSKDENPKMSSFDSSSLWFQRTLNLYCQNTKMILLTYL